MQTEGSKTKQGVVCRIYSRYLNLNLKWAMESQLSTVHAEVIDITITSKELSNQNVTGRNIRIYTICITTVEYLIFEY